MDWHRARHLVSGILVAGALVSGGIVGNVLLLGSADHARDPVGHLSARIAGQPAVTTTSDDTTTRTAATTPSSTAPATTQADPAGDDSGSSPDEGHELDD